MTAPTFEGMLTELLDDPELFGADGACPTRLEPSDGAPRVLLITGDNASGKSLVCKAFGRLLTDEGASVEFVGMAKRASNDGFQRMTTGDEGRQSTGQISVRTALRAMERMREAPGEREADKARVLILDEPDLGLSEAFAAALGRRIAEFCADLPEDAFGVAVVTHNREIARALAAIGPVAVRVGDDLRPLADWLRDGPLPVDDARLDGLGEVAHDRYIRIVRVMDARKEARLNAERRREKKAEKAVEDATARYRAVVRGAASFGDRERQAAVAYLTDLLDACAVREGRKPGFSLDDGALRYLGVALDGVGNVSFKGVRCGSGLRITFAHGPRGLRADRTPDAEQAGYLYHKVRSDLSEAAPKRLLGLRAADPAATDDAGQSSAPRMG